MSIKGFHTLWIRIQIKNKRFLKIPLPIQLSIFEELLDCFLDMLSIACFFIPKSSRPDSSTHRVTIHLLKEVVGDCIILLQSLSGEEPYDLVDVTTDEIRVLISVR